MGLAEEEFLIKPSPYHTKEEIQKYIDLGEKEVKGKKINNLRGASDFELIYFNRMPHLTDHRGNYLTRTGHKIDDFC